MICACGAFPPSIQLNHRPLLLNKMLHAFPTEIVGMIVNFLPLHVRLGLGEDFAVHLINHLWYPRDHASGMTES